jgi:hypothetical protein|tara:strand:+ start:105 stop:398 length:294 start_codon:yes stop_codon:yes gene_type:complete
MSMPKGFKSKNGYGTTKSLGGKSYHEIADHMMGAGFKMNHSTARNVFVNSMIKIAEKVSQTYDMKLDAKELKSMAINPDFQEAISDFIKENRRNFSE